ncbi:hypothetical protein SD70_13715 [Gordoniibacillus kamchatkensis]|uniref:DUF4355 domain-containing protein n=1 Tax=Gordoniibacillus kamchatkensis TaxID=1590651 RepID=A0ABR5AHD0_9BACL|nr:hypothetical protein [Paenibacillus sp. VKM B-2647]KIL40456.1 hypothetical protein SD70_13715 [Paenibacillus sp. VKM B-2647]
MSNAKSFEQIRDESAKQDAEIKRTLDKLSAGYAETSGKVVKEAEARQKAQVEYIRSRIEAGERVPVMDLLSYGYAKVDEERAEKEAATTTTLTAEQIAGKSESDKNVNADKGGVKFQFEESDKAAIQALRQQLDAILAKYES